MTKQEEDLIYRMYRLVGQSSKRGAVRPLTTWILQSEPTIRTYSDFLFSVVKETILKVQEDHCQDPNAILLTQEETLNLVFKKKSGIVKGLDMIPSSSLVITVSSSSLVGFIHWLEYEIIKLKEARVRDQEEQARNQEPRAKQEEVQKNIFNFLRSKGYDDALTYGGGSTLS